MSDQEQIRNDLQWLEDVDSTRALDWVRERNARTLKAFANGPEFEKLEKGFLEILDAKDKIIYPQILGDFVYNFWQDADHIKGILRRSPTADFVEQKPVWETILDIDALAKTDNENWIFKGSYWLKPNNDRALVHLSRGGKDASVIREFDVASRSFVAGGFELPEAKSDVTWVDRDTLLVSTDFGPGSMTTSGYPRLVKVLKRGENLADAREIFAAPETYMVAGHHGTFNPNLNGGEIEITITGGRDFYNVDRYQWKDRQTLVAWPLPSDIVPLSYFKNQILFTNRSELTLKSDPNRTYAKGSLLVLEKSELTSGQPKVQLVFEPDAASSLVGASSTSETVYVSIMKNVTTDVWQTSAPGREPLQRIDLPSGGVGQLTAVNADKEEAFVSYQNFFQPPTLYYLSSGLPPKKQQSLPARFNAKKLVATQEWITSRDGTRVPYFLLRRSDTKRNAKNPTMLYGYGGFEISMSPGYQQLLGDAWLNQGGVYAIANIRGGGEFGPRWHQAALGKNRQRAYDDFIGVAEHLIAEGFTCPEHLAIQGGSNGGLLVGAVFTQRPELFKAVVCQVPLLDMLRFHKLLAGASWIAEYGNPEIPSDAQFLRSISPFHNLDPNRSYPNVLFVTSTKDDRVHPAHARKMAALMEANKKPFFYYENIDGGHSAAANLKEYARRLAIEISFLRNQLT